MAASAVMCTAMILKEKTFTEARDWKQAAGDAAEKEMAHYLRRYFGDDADVFVLNDIRLEMDGDAAQMDHVLIHPAGLTIIESKSVSGKLQMKPDGEWLRWYDNRSSGMASPLVQAKLQVLFLRKFLRRMAKQPEVIDALAIDYMVAISSKGQFLPPPGYVVEEVCKADLICERIQTKLAGAAAFPAAYRRVLGDYMARRHTPLASAEVAPDAEPVGASPLPTVAAAEPERTAAPPVANFTYVGDKLRQTALWQRMVEQQGHPQEYITFCKSCRSHEVEFRYGKFGYYLKCLACGENTAIRLDCRQCRRQARLRKEGAALFVECSHCQLSEVVQRNDRAHALPS